MSNILSALEHLIFLFFEILLQKPVCFTTFNDKNTALYKKEYLLQEYRFEGEQFLLLYQIETIILLACEQEII